MTKIEAVALKEAATRLEKALSDYCVTAANIPGATITDTAWALEDGWGQTRFWVATRIAELRNKPK
ncbi:MAG TPA: hypothetical protein VMO76_14860 [Candidatus Udaeobacter sp.]|nr:hypothetical protein [Candidatus Udaeobacter sp.]